MAEGTRSGLWHHVIRAVEALNPCLVVIENVRGLLTSPATSPGAMELCPWCLGDAADQPAVRAFGAALGSLADLRFDARWCVVRASDIGAPHRRERVFLAAWPSSHRRAVQDTDQQPGDERWKPASREAQAGRPRSESRGRGGVAVADADARQDDQGFIRPALLQKESAPPSFSAAALHPSGLDIERWGPYAAAVVRWEALTRPAPAPTDPAGRLSPLFVEWMQGLEAGWVTSTPALSRPAQLSALGNGVVPQQAAAALAGLAPPVQGCPHRRAK
ncbi:DNA cytosine methyltransferase [Streptomyces sp. NPDC006512]|uniref:DNA cytosine methyltransferase n=1 Tax=Streptomyces sp. NPDC006512 TaxID=3154307 RepID=UPI0033B9B3AC